MFRKVMALMFLGACAVMEPQLVPSQWLVTDLGERVLLADDRVSIEFAEGRVSGVSGCNRYTGSYEMGAQERGEGPVSFGLLATTRMACIGEAAEIETAFLAALSEVDGYRFERGRLVLTASGAEVLRAQRQR